MMKRTILGVLSLCAAMGWWGALYPQFTLMEGTYRIVEEAEAEDDAAVTESEIDSSELYWSLLDGDSGRIRFGSRLLAEWREFHGSKDQQ